MADDAPYASGGGESNKRKYEDNLTPPPAVPRRPTGFSSTPDGAAPLASYNNVPPPMTEIEQAKQKAQEIAARILSAADPPKRARVENGAGGGGYDSNDGGTGFSSVPYQSTGQKPMGLGLGGPPQGGASYGYAGPTKRIEIPNGRVGVIIGKSGETIKYLQLQSGAKIQVTRDMDADPNSPTRGVELTGTPDQIAKAEQLINDVLAEAEAGGSGTVSRRLAGQPSGGEQFVMKIPNNKVGLVIGKGGETIKNMQASSGARIQVIPLHLPPGDTSLERTVQIDGTSEQIEAAKQLVNEVISENRLRNSSMGGGYAQQGYQSRPPTSWAQPGAQMQQQPGYGYAQPGAYPGPSPQYNSSQPHYPGYPPAPTSAGYAASWDPSTAPPNQQPAPGGGYDYYGQQPPAYSQGQGYSQDGYGGYSATAPQPGYGQPQSNPVPGYDQQQQGYNSTYGNYSNPTSETQTPAYGTTGDATQAPAASQAGYATAPASQGAYGTQPPTGYGPSYGPPQGQKPPSSQPAYGQQPQQSPTAQGGYAQPPVQPGYGHSQPPPTQPGYPQSDSGVQRQSSAYPTSQPGYGVAPYGAPPPAQGGYGQQQPAYGGGYSQPPVYSTDGSGAGARGAYDAAAPTSQTPQPSGSAKSSPPT